MAGLVTSSKTKGYPKKYEELRSQIQNGDLILYRGTSFLAKSIQYFDKAYYNHIGVVWKVEEADRLLTLDMWSGGLTCLPVSRRMDGYMDFCILRPKTSKEKKSEAVSKMLTMWEGKTVSYDTLLLFRVALIKATGIDITNLSSKDKFICSEFARAYTNELFDTYLPFENITPEDFLRYIDENFEVIGHTH